MKALVRQKAKRVVATLRAGRDSAEKHLWIMPTDYPPTFNKNKGGLCLMAKK